MATTDNDTAVCRWCDEEYSEGEGVAIGTGYCSAACRNKDRKGVDKSELVAALRELADELGCRPTTRDMAEEGQFAVTTYENKFGSWNDALSAAEIAQMRKQGRVSKEELLDSLQEAGDDLGHPPSSYEMKEASDHSINTYLRYFEDWEAALEEAGFDASNREQSCTRSAWTEDELKAEIVRVHDYLGRAPSRAEMSQYGEISPELVYARLGGWTTVLKELGLEPRCEVSEDATYGRGWNDTKKEEIRERDSYRCQFCGLSQAAHRVLFGKALNVHHIEPARDVADADDRNDPKNLISLCLTCHGRWEDALHRVYH